MQREEIELFFKASRTVAVGIPSSDINRDRPYFYFGTIIELTNEYLVIQYKDGLKKIRFSEIEDIHFAEVR